MFQIPSQIKLQEFHKSKSETDPISRKKNRRKAGLALNIGKAFNQFNMREYMRKQINYLIENWAVKQQKTGVFV